MAFTPQPLPLRVQTDPRPILIGLRGSGKSTVGALLAARLHRPFIDLDTLTAEYLGAPTPGDALRTVGEPTFRSAEASVLARELAPDANAAVLALGGGTPTAPNAADLLRAARAENRVRIIYLRAAPSTLRSRLSRTDLSARPALTDANAGPLAEIDALFELRDPLYRSIADVIIAVGELTPEQATDQVAAWLSIASHDSRFSPAPRDVP